MKLHIVFVGNLTEKTDHCVFNCYLKFL